MGEAEVGQEVCQGAEAVAEVDENIESEVTHEVPAGFLQYQNPQR